MKKESTGICKRVLAAAILWLTLPCILAQTPQEALETLLASPSLNRDRTAIYVWDLDADYQVTAHRAQAPMVPASVMKCVTTAALADVTHIGNPVTTDVFLHGLQKGDLFSGDIIIVGSGDPSLSDGRHKEEKNFIEEIAQALNRKGISRIEGRIIVDDSRFAGPATPASWVAGDLSQSYGTGFHGFNFEGNASGKKAVSEPSAVFRRKLTATLADAGIELTATDTEPGGKRALLLTHRSAPLADLMRSCMFRSDNLYAEAFLRLFGLQNGTDGSADGSARVAMQHWDALNFPVEGVDIVDGSGLSRDNTLTAEFLGTVLKRMKDNPDYVAFFPLTGEEGTVRNFMSGTPLQGYLALKTGSMNGIQSYAGYLLDEDFTPSHVVVVIANDLKNRSAFRSALSSFFLSLFTE